jgi:hypothetical protein
MRDDTLVAVPTAIVASAGLALLGVETRTILLTSG